MSCPSSWLCGAGSLAQSYSHLVEVTCHEYRKTECCLKARERLFPAVREMTVPRNCVIFLVVNMLSCSSETEENVNVSCHPTCLKGPRCPFSAPLGSVLLTSPGMRSFLLTASWCFLIFECLFLTPLLTLFMLFPPIFSQNQLFHLSCLLMLWLVALRQFGVWLSGTRTQVQSSACVVCGEFGVLWCAGCLLA